MVEREASIDANGVHVTETRSTVIDDEDGSWIVTMQRYLSYETENPGEDDDGNENRKNEDLPVRSQPRRGKP